jgi:hypothetical protein
MKYICNYPNAQFTSTGNGIPISSNGTHFQYCPFLDSTSGNFQLVWSPTGNLPVLVQCVTHFVLFPVLGYAISGAVIHWAPCRNWTLCVWSNFRYWAMPFPERSLLGSRTGTRLYVGGPISGTGLCHFRYGPSLGPVPEVDSMRVVSFCSKESGSAFLLALTAKSVVFVTCINVKYDTSGRYILN